jgi:hypothetical protein
MQYEAERYLFQQKNYDEWIRSLSDHSKLVVIEVGAGTPHPPPSPSPRKARNARQTRKTNNIFRYCGPYSESSK